MIKLIELIQENKFSDYSNDALTDMIINLSRYEGNKELIASVKDELERRKKAISEAKLTISGTDKAIKMLKSELKSNNINFETDGNKIMVNDSPKAKMAVKMVKERVGMQSIKLAEEIKSEATFTKKYDDSPKLKGKQTKLPDEVQAKIIKEGDHEVSMAQNSLEAIAKAAMELSQKIGSVERNIPGWIQDHITNAENYIEQAAQGFHELNEIVKILPPRKTKGTYINRKEVDLKTIQLDGIDMNDYPDFSDAYIAYAEFMDGTKLNTDECFELEGKVNMNELVFDYLY
jgi:hypothetical protein